MSACCAPANDTQGPADRKPPFGLFLKKIIGSCGPDGDPEEGTHRWGPLCHLPGAPWDNPDRRGSPKDKMAAHRHGNSLRSWLVAGQRRGASWCQMDEPQPGAARAPCPGLSLHMPAPPPPPCRPRGAPRSGGPDDKSAPPSGGTGGTVQGPPGLRRAAALHACGPSPLLTTTLRGQEVGGFGGPGRQGFEAPRGTRSAVATRSGRCGGGTRDC